MSDRESPNVDGDALFRLVTDLYPICRSITGHGVRQTLSRVSEMAPLTIREVPSGTPVLDWTVPQEWNISDAWIATTDGRRVVDFRDHNLHVVNYSRPFRGRLTRAELNTHLHSLPNRPDWIPYRTTYYADTWGFCLTERQRDLLTEDEYDVCVDSSLEAGSMTFGEAVVPGRRPDEILLSAHVCHPSLANDNLSGIAVLAAALQHVRRAPRNYTYRFIFAPGTIGALTWLALNEKTVGRVRHGLVVACVGDRGRFTYKRSRQGDAEIDRAVAHVLAHATRDPEIREFSPDGYDERQYRSPGFDLPVGRLTRTPNGEYPEYHTSADNLDLLGPEQLAEAAATLIGVLDVLEGNTSYANLFPKGEPQLGRRGLYRSLGGVSDAGQTEQAIRWVLNLSDGRYSLLHIAERAGLPFAAVRSAADLLVEHGLLGAPTGAPPTTRTLLHSGSR